MRLSSITRDSMRTRPTNTLSITRKPGRAAPLVMGISYAMVQVRLRVTYAEHYVTHIEADSVEHGILLASIYGMYIIDSTADH